MGCASFGLVIVVLFKKVKGLPQNLSPELYSGSDEKNSKRTAIDKFRMTVNFEVDLSLNFRTSIEATDVTNNLIVDTVYETDEKSLRWRRR